MQIIISPSKTQDFTRDFSEKLNGKIGDFSVSEFNKETKKLAKLFKKFSQKDLEKMMKISPKLAELNFERFAKWNGSFSNRKKDKKGEFNFSPAIFAFLGDVYRGFDLENWNKKDFDYAQKNLKIISGFYGVLEPLNFLKPYRLEMGTKISFKIGKREYKNLYEFWGEKITDYLCDKFRKDKEKILLNLASVEYFKVIDRKKIEQKGVKIIDVDFKIKKGNELKTIAIFAKMARGEMANWIIKNKISSEKDLEKFNENGWKISFKNSSKNKLFFVKNKK